MAQNKCIFEQVAGCENLLLGFRIDVALVIGLYECQQLEKDITSGDVSIDSFSQYQPSFFFCLALEKSKQTLQWFLKQIINHHNPRRKQIYPDQADKQRVVVPD